MLLQLHLQNKLLITSKPPKRKETAEMKLKNQLHEIIKVKIQLACAQNSTQIASWVGRAVLKHPQPTLLEAFISGCMRRCKAHHHGSRHHQSWGAQDVTQDGGRAEQQSSRSVMKCKDKSLSPGTGQPLQHHKQALLGWQGPGGMVDIAVLWAWQGRWGSPEESKN